MTRDEVLAMPAGRELDALVAEHVFGWRRYTAIRFGQRVVVIVPDRQKCWDWYTRQQGDPGSWDATDAAVTATGMGRHLPPYSTDIAAAWTVVEHNAPCGWFDRYALIRYGDHYAVIHLAGSWAGMPVTEGTAPLAICRAALLTTLESR